MSVTGSYWRLTRDEWSRFEPYLDAEKGTEFWRAGEQAFVDLISDEWMTSDRYLDLQKEWHLLHCLLTDRWEKPDEITPVPSTLGKAIRGGTDTPFEAHDGMTRYLRPDEVQCVADALAEISPDELLAKVDIEVVRRAGIYSWGPESEIETIEAVVREDFPKLINFFAVAARARNVVVLSLD